MPGPLDATTSTGTDASEALWARFKTAPNRHERDQLIVLYAPLVKYVAGRFAAGLPSSVETADLVSYGMFGLIDAIDKYELDRGVRFESYAISRIRGAIIDELRRLDWVPRSVRTKVRAVEQAVAKLEAELGRSPSEEEIAAVMRVSVEQLQSILGQISYVGMAALDEAIGSEDGEVLALRDRLADVGELPGASLEREETRAQLVSAIKRMSERERTVLTLYYFEGLTLGQIGEVLGVTESRVCQIHTKAVLHLRNYLSAEDRRSG